MSKDKRDKTVEITVKSVYVGNQNMEQIFYEIIRQKGLEILSNKCYNKGVVFPDVHAC
jgi:hypothetical protein